MLRHNQNFPNSYSQPATRASLNNSQQSLPRRLPRPSLLSRFWCINAGSNTCTRRRNGEIICQQNSTTLESQRKRDECFEVHTCILENVCFDVQDAHILRYYVPRSPGALFLPPSDLPIHSHCGKVESLRLQQELMTTEALFQNKTLAIIGRFYSVSKGHTLGDEVIALAMVLDKFGLLGNPSVQPVISGEMDSTDYYSILSPLLPLALNSIRGQCFARILTGARSNFFAYNWKQPYEDGYPAKIPGFQRGVLLRVRNHAIRRLSITEPDLSDRPFRLLIVQKDTNSAHHKSWIGNFEIVLGEIRQAFPLWHIDVVKWTAIPNVRQQAELVTKAHIYFTLWGSDAMNAFFLREGSVLVVSCRVHLGQVLPSAEFFPLHNHQAWVKTIQICGDSFMTVRGELVIMNSSALVEVLSAARDDVLSTIQSRRNVN